MMDDRKKRKAKEAVAYYSEKINKGTANRSHYLFRSACYEYLKNYPLALKDALEVTRKDPFNCKGHYQAYKVYLAMGNIPKAQEIAEQFNEKSFEKLNVRLHALKETERKIHQAQSESEFNRHIKRALKIAPASEKYRTWKFDRKKIVAKANPTSEIYAKSKPQENVKVHSPLGNANQEPTKQTKKGSKFSCTIL